MKITALIPAYKPGPELETFVEDLANQSLEWIVIIDDGSGPEYKQIFDKLKLLPKVNVLTHENNCGKGAALKTGFKYIYEKIPESLGIVTADADGQHGTKDVLKIASRLESSNGLTLVIGVRNFDKKVPLRSMIGNKLTSLLFKKIFHLAISDTQTGLRGIPRKVIPEFLPISYNHYEYETEMLLVCARNNIKIIEVPIETVYINGNSSSHFNPLIDSLKIYFVLFRFTLSSIISAVVDFIIFITVYPLIGNILWSTYAARAVSLTVNYTLVTKKVFYAKNRFYETFPKYLLLVIISGYISSQLITLIHYNFGISIGLAKIITESILYIVNFYIQKRLIFTKQNI